MSISLTYFGFDGSRGLECRLALTVAGVDFEDIRVGRGQWAEMKRSQPYSALPVLTVDGKQLPQSTAIMGYIGLAYGLHPTDPWTSGEHYALMQSVEDLRSKVPGGRDMSDDEKKTARAAFASGWLTRWATSVSARITGPYLEGETLNVADIKLFVILRAYLGGSFDHIPASFFDDYPALLGLVSAVEARPSVKSYFLSL
jgi:glutathione S-transferase